MELKEAIYTRRSVRVFQDKPVSKEIIEELIDAAQQAPSACDRQAWKFIIINDPEVRKKLFEAGSGGAIKNAPIIILVLYNNQTDNLEHWDHVQSAAAAIQNLLLTAHDKGLGACWICHLPTKAQIRNLFQIPHNYDPIAAVVLGYPAQKPLPRPRLHKASELISYNKFDFKEEIPSKINPQLTLKRALRKAYYLLPGRKLLKKKVDDSFEKRFS